MTFKTVELRAQLIEQTKANINKVETFRTRPLEELNFKITHDKWSVLECIEHLNLYSHFYNPEIKNCIETKHSKSNTLFVSGLIGNYFVKTMLPKKKLNNMKTFKDKDPSGSNLDTKVLDKFICQQKELIELIENSKNCNLTKTKTAISISKFIKIRLGDTFRFIIAHNERHIIQAQNTLQLLNNK